MKYHFEYGFVGVKTMVITLDKNDLTDMWADEGCDKAAYEDLTVSFEIDRYLRLLEVLAKLKQEDRHFGRVEMAVQVSSCCEVTRKQKIRGGYIGIYYCGLSAFEVTWWNDYSMGDYGVDLNMPDGFLENPAAWLAAETAKHGFRRPEESGV